MSVLPRAAALVMGLFDKEIADLAEMSFQWDRPYLVDSSKFAARFWSATPLDRGLYATIAYDRDHPSGGQQHALRPPGTPLASRRGGSSAP